MNDARFASLSSGLLARKGAAKPAMRRHGSGHMGAGLDDLGWNDMGQATAAAEDGRRPAPAPSPALRQQEELAASLAAPHVVRIADPAELVPAAPETLVAAGPSAPPTPRRAAGGKDKAAFTLRLDSERHLRLRLASAVTHRSAQALVTEAVDALLGGMAELETLAGQVPPHKPATRA